MNYMETDYQPNEFSLLSVLLIDMREYTFKQSTTKASTRAFRFICFPTVDFRVCEKLKPHFAW